jgi:hypothetical protein
MQLSWYSQLTGFSIDACVIRAGTEKFSNKANNFIIIFKWTIFHIGLYNSFKKAIASYTVKFIDIIQTESRENIVHVYFVFLYTSNFWKAMTHAPFHYDFMDNLYIVL